MAAPPTQSLVLTLEEARRAVEAHASRIAPGGIETLDLLAAAGRVLAEPITADRDIPPFRRSTRDGYAVCSVDLATLPATLKVMGEIKAGSLQQPSALNGGQAFSIMTGAPVPPGADAV
jgi:molybdopterin molybdotransferase